MKRKDSRRVIIACTALLLLLLFFIQYGKDAKSIVTVGKLILIVLGSLLGAINFSLAYTHLRLRWEHMKPDEFYDRTAFWRAIIRTGGAVSGIALLSAVLGLFGFSAMLLALPREGQEVGYIGIIILLIATYALARKASIQKVC